MLKVSLRNLFAAAVVISINGGLTFAQPQTLEDGRCGAWGDSLDQGEQTQNRVNFALACERNTKSIAEIHYNFEQGLGRAGSTTRTPGYPSYGLWNAQLRTFGDWDNPAPKWFAPKTATKDCSLIKPGYEIAFFCASGCYTAEQGVLFPEGYVEIAKAREKDLANVMSLDPNSTLDTPHLREAGVAQYIADVRAGEQEILEFTMASGGKLRVTKNHPLLDSDGQMRQAQTLRKGEFLVKADGTKDAISTIEERKIYGKVYNIKVDSQDPKAQIVVAQGYLNGSVYYQNEGVKELNRRLLRTSITAKLLE